MKLRELRRLFSEAGRKLSHVKRFQLDELEEIFEEAVENDDEVVQDLIMEIHYLREELARKESGKAKRRAHYQKGLHDIEISRLRRGQEYMRDRIVLALVDMGRWEEAVIANNESIQAEATWEDIREEHHDNAKAVNDIRHKLTEVWRGLFGKKTA